MSFNPLLVLGVGGAAYFLFKKPAKSTKKVNKPVDEKPIVNTTGFTLNDCNEMIITNQDQFSEYNKSILDSLIADKAYQNPLNTSAMKFAKEYLQKLLPSCANKQISTPNQFVIIYTVLLKGIEFFLSNKFLVADRWKKYFANDVELDLYISSQEKDFTIWAEEIEMKDVDDEALKAFEKIFAIQEIPTMDKGFQYDCVSIKVTNDVLMLSYFEKLAKIVANTEKEFENPSMIELKKFAEYMLSIVNSECYDRYIKAELTDHERVIILKLFELFISSYINAMIGIKEEVEAYKANYANEQMILLLQDFDIPEAARQEFDVMIKEKGMYP